MNNQVENRLFTISNLSVPCPHAELRGSTVIKKLWTFHWPRGRDRSESPPCWIFRVKQIHQSTASERTARPMPCPRCAATNKWASNRWQICKSPPQRATVNNLDPVDGLFQVEMPHAWHGSYDRAALMPGLVDTLDNYVSRKSWIQGRHSSVTGSPILSIHWYWHDLQTTDPSLVYDNSFSAGTVFISQNLTSVDVRFWRIKTIPALKELKYL